MRPQCRYKRHDTQGQQAQGGNVAWVGDVDTGSDGGRFHTAVPVKTCAPGRTGRQPVHPSCPWPPKTQLQVASRGESRWRIPTQFAR